MLISFVINFIFFEVKMLCFGKYYLFAMLFFIVQLMYLRIVLGLNRQLTAWVFPILSEFVTKLCEKKNTPSKSVLSHCAARST
jgi:hypothetical protein